MAKRGIPSLKMAVAPLVATLFAFPHVAAAQDPAADRAAARELAALVAAEQQRIAELREELDRRNAALAALAARIDALAPPAGAEPAAPPTVFTVTTPQRAPEPATGAAEPPRFDFYAESLFRLATLHQSYDGCDGCPDRTLGRLRLRFGAEGRLAPGLRAVFGFSVGELNDPNTVYQTLGGNLSRKVATFDRSYLSFRPPRASWMDLTVGKFPYPWVRSSMTFDVDFYPEGLSERFSFDLKRTKRLTNVSVQGLQIVVNEQANGGDTMIVGGQATATVRLSGPIATRAIVTGLDIKRPEHVLRAQLDGSDVGVRNTNAILVSNGQARYASGFRYANAIVENRITTGYESLPLFVAGEYQRNLRAVSSRDTAASFRVELGRQQQPGDWAFGWHLFRVEQDAIVSALGESDWRAPSNVVQHRFNVNYLLQDHVQALFTWYRGRTLDRDLPGAVLVPALPAGRVEPWANRLYFDIQYRF
jgi:Putative porin